MQCPLDPDRRPGGRRARCAVLALAVTATLAAAVCGCNRRVPERPLPGDVLELEIKGHKLSVEVANDDALRAAGLMYRKSLCEDCGMVFVYRTGEKLSFWMRNTTIPLSIAFLDDRGAILQIEDMRPKDESHTVSKYKVRYALEVNQGWFQRHGISVGDAFTDFDAKVRPYQEN